MSESYFSNYSGKEYDLDNLKLKASLEDIIVATISNQESEAESEADSGIFYNVYWSNGFIHIDFCESYETNESYYGNTDYKETKVNAHTLYKIKASAIDFINIVIDYDKYRKEYVFAFGNRRIYTINLIINKDTEQAIEQENKQEIIKVLLRMLLRYRR